MGHKERAECHLISLPHTPYPLALRKAARKSWKQLALPCTVASEQLAAHPELPEPLASVRL